MENTRVSSKEFVAILCQIVDFRKVNCLPIIFTRDSCFSSIFINFLDISLFWPLLNSIYRLFVSMAYASVTYLNKSLNTRSSGPDFFLLPMALL